MTQVNGQVTGVFIANNPGSMVSTRIPLVSVSYNGFEGDRHAGMTMRTGGRNPHYPHGTEIRNCRQVSIGSMEELDQIAANLTLPKVLGEWLGINLILQGIPRVTQVPPSSRLYFQNGVTLVVEGENLPCTHAGEVIQMQYPHVDNLVSRFPKAAMHIRGIVAWVERPGIIREGEGVMIEIAPKVWFEP